MKERSVSVPDKVREEIRQKLWGRAESLGWADLSAADKTRYYEHWTREPEVGGVLSRYMDPPRVRVYLKDAVFKPYSRARHAHWERCAEALGVDSGSDCVVSYIKPHGRRLADGRVVCWGPATAWKMVLMALHERTHGRQHGARPFAAVLTRSVGRYREEPTRRMVEDAAVKLCVERVLWLDT